MITNESSRMTSSYNQAQRVKQKIIFLGDQHVGKTCIIERFMYDVFSEKTHPTVGVDFLAKTLHIDDKNIRLQLWDTAGQERFRSLIPSYLRDSSCSVIVYDVTSRSSFDNVDSWIKEYRDNKGPEAPSFLVANKIDLIDQRVVQKNEGEKKAQNFGINYFEISAKIGDNIQNMFVNIALLLAPNESSMLNSNIVNTPQENANNINIVAQKEKTPNKNQNNGKIAQQNKIKLGLTPENNREIIKKESCC